MPGKGWEGWWQWQDLLCHCWPRSQGFAGVAQRSSTGTAEAESLNSPSAAQQAFAKRASTRSSLFSAGTERLPLHSQLELCTCRVRGGTQKGNLKHFWELLCCLHCSGRMNWPGYSSTASKMGWLVICILLPQCSSPASSEIPSLVVLQAATHNQYWTEE